MKTAKIRVYTKPVDKLHYPEGLARAVHMSCLSEAGEQVLNKDYGILFARGGVSEENTIVPCGVEDPRIFSKEGKICICARKVFEDGSRDEDMEDSVLLWTTEDLIHFSDEQIVSASEVMKYDPSDSLEVDGDVAENAVRYWSPVLFTKLNAPKEIKINSAEELKDFTAELLYSDGSVRKKKISLDEGLSLIKAPGEYELTGHIRQQRFGFPLAEGYGDPVLFHWEGKWYYISTNDNLNDIGFYVREAEDIHDLFKEGVTEHLILPFDKERGLEQTFWAPEFHVIGGELYILFAVSGSVWGPQCHMMRLKKGKPIIEADSWEDPIRVVRKDGKPLAESAITLDMTYIKAESGSYLVWSYREHIGTKLDSGSMLYIARTDDSKPWMLTSDPVLLTRPLYGWENVAGTINNEGPYAFLKDGRVYLTYSGGSANAYTYALGLFTADTKADLLDLSSWSKSITPVLTFRSVDGEYGPGHNSFFVNEEDELMIAYHGETDIDERLRCDGIRRIHFRYDGSPYFGMAFSDDIRDTEIKVKVTLV